MCLTHFVCVCVECVCKGVSGCRYVRERERERERESCVCVGVVVTTQTQTVQSVSDRIVCFDKKHPARGNVSCDVERLDTELNKRSAAPCCDGHTRKCHSVIVLRLPCAVSQDQPQGNSGRLRLFVVRPLV